MQTEPKKKKGKCRFTITPFLSVVIYASLFKRRKYDFYTPSDHRNGNKQNVWPGIFLKDYGCRE